MNIALVVLSGVFAFFLVRDIRRRDIKKYLPKGDYWWNGSK